MTNNQTIYRPTNFDNFIGQNKLVFLLKTMIHASTYRKEILDHILFYGPPGTGKTTLATIIANELNTKIHYLQGSMLEKKADILSVFSSLNEKDIVFIDEIHSINKNVEELIYSAMEDFNIDIIIGPEGNTKVMRMKLKPFTLIAATTKPNLLSQPLKDRFGLKAKLNFYNEEDLINILRNFKSNFDIKIDQNCLKLIASYSRNTPRVALHLIKRVWDLAINLKEERISKEIANNAFKLLDLYPYGLNKDHIDYLFLLKNTFDTQYVSIDTIASMLNFQKENLIYEIEPLLIQNKLIKKTPRGRTLTSKGIDYLLNIKFNN
ncbi:Holliday junction branch migration DNA helicase RuvB [Mycoplasma sp. 1018B]|uniref:Holliday junction branch migration DNA helicase RuvB n=1 Tax=Mycoplasma sp. 1018B TaxID=2967302 RepID=UPI00211BEB64|nr:Holliday junction branch migration DNA helicase RuvB [Mycoplasma sp. 1018B]UUM18976.1 Holliday junction branch migration DNA helicase RuvB [Mycoplasma sp. 1018B]